MIEIYSREQALAIIAEVKKLTEAKKPTFHDPNFPAQTKFLKSKKKRKAALCTRRAGKSYGVGLGLWEAAWLNPGSSVLYLALTRQSAKNIMWKDVLAVQNRILGMEAKKNEKDLFLTLPNGSIIQLAGADASAAEMEKYLGGKYAKVVIDEAGSFRQDLRKLVYEYLEPALADLDGPVELIGTPTQFTRGLFFDVTTGKENGWDVHHWSALDNPYMREKWLKRIAAAKEVNARIEETPGFKRHYLGEWVIDDKGLVYKYNLDRNLVDSLPAEAFINVLGVDFGYNDDSAFVLACYSEYLPHVYFRHAYKRKKMIVSDVITRIRWYIEHFNPSRIVVDNASKQIAEELKSRFEIPVVAADKHSKYEYIELMNNDFIQGNIKLLSSDTECLQEEYANLIWDERSKNKIEHAGCENHATDAGLYAWRSCLQYLSMSRPSLDPDLDEMDSFWEREAERIRHERDADYWERDWIGGIAI